MVDCRKKSPALRFFGKKKGGTIVLEKLEKRGKDGRDERYAAFVAPHGISNGLTITTLGKESQIATLKKVTKVKSRSGAK